QLPDEEQEHQDAGGQQQLAEDAERAAQQAGPAAGAVAGGHHPAFAMSMVREPSKAGTVTSSRTSVRSPRPTSSTHCPSTFPPGEASSAAVSSSGSPIAGITNGREYTRPSSDRVLPAHRNEEPLTTRWSCSIIASAPPAHSALM